MKITIRELKELIKEQIEEAGELAAAAKGAPVRHSASAVDNQGMPPPGSLELDPKDPITPGKSLRTRQRNPYTGTGREHEWELAQSSLYPVADLEEGVEEISKGGTPANKRSKKSWVETERARASEIERKNSKAKFKKEDEEGWERAKKYGRQPEGELEEQVETPATVQENIRKMVREAIRQHLNEKKKGLPPWLKPGFKKDKDKTDKKETDESGLDEENTKKKPTSTKKKPAFLKKKTKK